MKVAPAAVQMLQLAASLLVASHASAISITSIEVPVWVPAGGTAELRCSWQLQGSKMWALKWYQGLNEIYRFTPSKRRSEQVFDNPHLSVETNLSSRGQVRISNVSHSAAGLFRCEISGEAPQFRTLFVEKELKVVTLPDGGPQLWGVKDIYSPGDWVDMTCTTPPARPPLSLSLSINGWQPPLDRLASRTSVGPGHEALSVSSLRLRFVLRPEILITGNWSETQLQEWVDLSSKEVNGYSSSKFPEYSFGRRLSNTSNQTWKNTHSVYSEVSSVGWLDLSAEERDLEAKNIPRIVRVLCLATLPDIGYEESTEVLLNIRPQFVAAGRGGRPSEGNSFTLKDMRQRATVEVGLTLLLLYVFHS